jgi:hypothetical protein
MGPNSITKGISNDPEQPEITFLESFFHPFKTLIIFSEGKIHHPP